MRKRGRTDANQAEIVAALRKSGCSVLPLSLVGNGCPDLLVARNGRTVLMECKTKGGKLNRLQKQFHASWQGEIVTIWSAIGAVEMMQPPWMLAKFTVASMA